MSTLSVSNITDGTTTVGTSYVVNGSAKAWVNFNGTGTIAARNSLNLSSLTDNGTGQYQVDYTNSFSDVDYSVAGVASGALTDVGGTVSASVTGRRSYNDAGTYTDPTYYYHTAHGDLA